LITGINGLLGQNLVQEYGHDHEIFGLDLNPGIFEDLDHIHVKQMDLNNTNALGEHINQVRPGKIIHTAAYTNVDRAEDDHEIAFAVNAEVPKYIANICLDLDIPLVHISTDYVFSGDSGPYAESDQCDARGKYAESKLAGETVVLESGAKAAVIRPNVMYGHGKHLSSSFVEWLDQKAWDIWHFGSKEVVSRYTFALKIADTFGLSSALINAISTVDLNQKAPRPMRSGLICEKLKKELTIPIMSIDEELALLKEEMHVS